MKHLMPAIAATALILTIASAAPSGGQISTEEIQSTTPAETEGKEEKRGSSVTETVHEASRSWNSTKSAEDKSTGNRSTVTESGGTAAGSSGAAAETVGIATEHGSTVTETADSGSLRRDATETGDKAAASRSTVTETADSGSSRRDATTEIGDKAAATRSTVTETAVSESSRRDATETGDKAAATRSTVTETGVSESSRRDATETVGNKPAGSKSIAAETVGIATENGSTVTETADSGSSRPDATTETGDEARRVGSSTRDTGDEAAHNDTLESNIPEHKTKDPLLQSEETPVCPELSIRHVGCNASQVEGDIFAMSINNSELPNSLLNCTENRDGNGTQYNWWQILIETGGKPGSLKGEPSRKKVAASSVRNPCVRPLELPDGASLFPDTYESADSTTFYRNEIVFPRFQETPKFFNDVRGILVWTPPEAANDTRRYKIFYVLDDTGFWLLVRGVDCIFINGNKEPFCVNTDHNPDGEGLIDIRLEVFSTRILETLLGGG